MTVRRRTGTVKKNSLHIVLTCGKNKKYLFVTTFGFCDVHQVNSHCVIQSSFINSGSGADTAAAAWPRVIAHKKTGMIPSVPLFPS